MGSLPDPECSGVGHLSQVRTRLRLSQPRSWNAPLQGMCSGCLAVQALPAPTSSLQIDEADARIRTADPFHYELSASNPVFCDLPAKLGGRAESPSPWKFVEVHRAPADVFQ